MAHSAACWGACHAADHVHARLETGQQSPTGQTGTCDLACTGYHPAVHAGEEGQVVHQGVGWLEGCQYIESGVLERNVDRETADQDMVVVGVVGLGLGMGREGSDQGVGMYEAYVGRVEKDLTEFVVKTDVFGAC